jgi:hypothetical protein
MGDLASAHDHDKRARKLSRIDIAMLDKGLDARQALGGEAKLIRTGASLLRGRSQGLGHWIYPVFHPAYQRFGRR